MTGHEAGRIAGLVDRLVMHRAERAPREFFDGLDRVAELLLLRAVSERSIVRGRMPVADRARARRQLRVIWEDLVEVYRRQW